MTSKFKTVFGDKKPVIAMVHLGALPGSPLHDYEGGVGAIVEGARKDLIALQAAGFDAVMFGNENDRPYEFKVDTASTATMGYVIGRLLSHADQALYRAKHGGRNLVCVYAGEPVRAKPSAQVAPGLASQPS